MPKFCPNCGKQLNDPEANFCENCGFALKKKPVPEESIAGEEPYEEEALRVSIFDIGNKLEEVVEKIFRAQGYETERRKRLVGKSGTHSEIDVVAKKSGRIIAVECKNYAEPVGIEKVRDFAQKLQDLGFEGIFVAYNGFTEGAEQFAQSQRIQMWDHGELSEKWLTISVGRVESRRGQSLTLEYALPLNIDFTNATHIELQNKDKVKVIDTELIYHPYLAIGYSFRGQVKDPTKKLHRFEEKDVLFVDALDGKVLNPMPEKGVGVLKKTLQTLVSTRAHVENERNKKLLKELRDKKPSAKYSLDIENDYRVSKLKPIIKPRQAIAASIDFIIDKNTQEIAYHPKTKDENFFPETKYMTYVPKRNDIQITREDVIIIPRWSIDFDSLGRGYKKEILACSGTILEDTLSYCPKHFKIGALTIISKKTIAVCEICGQSLCEDHVKRCPVCNKWLCEDHGIECSECHNRFCKEHINLTCPICNLPLCNSCMIICPICNRHYGRKHAVKCDKCNILVCPDCVVTSGLIRKTRLCKKCTT